MTRDSVMRRLRLRQPFRSAARGGATTSPAGVHSAKYGPSASTPRAKDSPTNGHAGTCASRDVGHSLSANKLGNNQPRRCQAGTRLLLAPACAASTKGDTKPTFAQSESFCGTGLSARG